jgi:tetratricopeptide (TPR) repeat protein
LIAFLLGFGLAMAQTEPTINQVYATAQAGKLEQAQLMIQQVLIAHPNSAKAFFVRSELYARQGDLIRARESLATAEKLAPGLPFAKAEVVRALHSQLSAAKPAAIVTRFPSHSTPPAYASPTAVPPAESSSSWLIPLLLAGSAFTLGFFIFRKKKTDPFAQRPDFANHNAMSGPQTFGNAGTPYSQPAYANQSGMNEPPSFGMGNGSAVQQPYGPPAGTGLGGRIMGGVGVASF